MSTREKPSEESIKGKDERHQVQRVVKGQKVIKVRVDDGRPDFYQDGIYTLQMFSIIDEFLEKRLKSQVVIGDFPTSVVCGLKLL